MRQLGTDDIPAEGEHRRARRKAHAEKKSSSLVSVVAVTELMRVSEQAVSITFRATEFYVTAALIYLVLTSLLAWIGKRFELQLARSV